MKFLKYPLLAAVSAGIGSVFGAWLTATAVVSLIRAGKMQALIDDFHAR